jgi:hypothetical protein
MNVTQAALSRKLAAWKKVFGEAPSCSIRADGTVELRPVGYENKNAGREVSPLEEWKANRNAAS